VARRCGCGKPQVIQTGSILEDGTPFPTFWWLTCKKLSSAVGGLESRGLMAPINKRLAEDLEFLRALRESTAKYCSARDGGGAKSDLRHPGGGPEHVKCLHAHLAHHLVTGDNPVGAWVVEQLAESGHGPYEATPESSCI